jgi:Mg2+ and Co2+ transporter CorA
MSTIRNERAVPPDAGIEAYEDEPQKQAIIRAYACGPTGARPIPVDRAIPWFDSKDAVIENCQLVWVDIVNPGSEAASFLRDQLRFHPLAIEDCLRGRQRPKVERYPGYFFLVAYAARINTERDRVAFNELHAFIGDRYIVTVHDHRIDEVRETLARWRSAPAQFTSVARWRMRCWMRWWTTTSRSWTTSRTTYRRLKP